MKVGTLYMLIFSIFLAACSKELDNEIYFVGDSLIARWDLQKSFPTCETHNDGVSGTGIRYIESKKNTYHNCTIVALSGTNDVFSERSDLESYVFRYINALKTTGASSVYILSIPPRLYNENDINKYIVSLNRLLQEQCKRSGMTFVDVYDDLCREETLNSQYTLDGIHLNEYGYEIITKKIKQTWR